MGVGAQLRAARLERKLSLSELARLAQLSKGFISQVENGTSSPSLRSLRLLTDALNLSPGTLLEAAGEVSAGDLLQPREVESMSGSPGSLHIFGLPAGQGLTSVPVRTGGHGTAALISIPVGGAAFGGTTGGIGLGTASCAVLRGSVRIVQGKQTLVATQGEVATFAPGHGYRLTCASGAEASIFLSLPAGCQPPALLAAPVVQTEYPRFAIGTGPFKLVEMRAARLASVRQSGREQGP